MKKKIKRWIAVDITLAKGTLNDWEGTDLVMKNLPIDDKFHCKLCKKKPHIYVVDSKEGEVFLFCDYPHLSKFYEGEELE